MLTLLLVVLVAGVASWVISVLDIPQPYKTIALAILLIMVIVFFFQTGLGVSLPR